MSKSLRIVGKLPIPAALKLEWQREILDCIYAKEIATARKSQDHQRIEEIEHEQRFEIDLHTEEFDLFITNQLLKKANKLRVPTHIGTTQTRRNPIIGTRAITQRAGCSPTKA